MAFRLGVDILSIDRVSRAVERTGDRFLQRAFTTREIRECLSSDRPHACLAGRFAAKESVYKALQSMFNLNPRWREIEVLTEGGRPKAMLWGPTAELALRNGVEGIDVSISHDRNCRAAVAVALVKYAAK